MGEAQRYLEVKVVPAQPAFPACWADRGKGGQQSETGGDGHRRQTESNRPREKHTVRDSKMRHCISKGKCDYLIKTSASHMASHRPTDRGDNLQKSSKEDMPSFTATNYTPRA